MSKKSLLETNPFLKDPEMRMKIVETVTVSSSSIEGIQSAAEQAIKNISSHKTAFSAAQACASSGKEQT